MPFLDPTVFPRYRPFGVVVPVAKPVAIGDIRANANRSAAINTAQRHILTDRHHFDLGQRHIGLMLLGDKTHVLYAGKIQCVGLRQMVPCSTALIYRLQRKLNDALLIGENRTAHA